MNQYELIDWLLENGGPVVRYRTAKELSDKSEVDIDCLTKDLLSSDKVAKVLADIEDCSRNINLRNWHSSKKECTENAFSRALEMGLTQEIQVFYEKVQPFREWVHFPSPQDHTPIHSIFFAWCFIRGGFEYDDIIEFVKKRLDYIYISAKEQVLDIYAKGDELKGIPKKFADECLRNEYNQYRGDKPLLLIHDLYALAFLPKKILDEDLKRKVNCVIEYILKEEFQRIREGYGYIYLKERNTCYSCGWSPNLPWYNGFVLKGIDENKLFMRFELMSHFTKAHDNKWFQACLNHFEQYRTSEGTYKLPQGYLQEKPSGYYVLGAYMGLESKRTEKALEVESTFRMLAVKKRIANSIGTECIV